MFRCFVFFFFCFRSRLCARESSGANDAYGRESYTPIGEYYIFIIISLVTGATEKQRKKKRTISYYIVTASLKFVLRGAVRRTRRLLRQSK